MSQVSRPRQARLDVGHGTADFGQTTGVKDLWIQMMCVAVIAQVEAHHVDACIEQRLPERQHVISIGAALPPVQQNGQRARRLERRGMQSLQRDAIAACEQQFVARCAHRTATPLCQAPQQQARNNRLQRRLRKATPDELDKRPGSELDAVFASAAALHNRPWRCEPWSPASVASRLLHHARTSRRMAGHVLCAVPQRMARQGIQPARRELRIVASAPDRTSNRRGGFRKRNPWLRRRSGSAARKAADLDGAARRSPPVHDHLRS